MHGSRQSSAGNKSLEMATQRLMEVNIAHVELQTRYEELRIQLEEEREQHKAHTEEVHKSIACIYTLLLLLTMEPLNKDTFGTSHFVLCREVILFER